MATRRRREDELFGPPHEGDTSDDADIDPAAGGAVDEAADEPDSDLGLGEMGSDAAPAPDPDPLPADLADPAPAPPADALSELSGEAPTEPLFADEPPEEESATQSFWTRLANRVPGRRALTNRRRAALILVSLVVVAAIVAIIVGTTSTPPPPPPSSAEVTSGSIRSTVHLDGVVVRQSTQTVGAPVTGTVTDISVRPGDAVTEGEQVATVAVLPLPSPSPTFSGTTSPSPTPSVSPITESVTAPIGGTVGALSVTKGQIVVSGQSLLTVIPAQFDVIASVPQNQLYRFYTPPLSIQAVIPHQDQPIDCAYQSIGGNLPTSGANNVLQEEVDLRCTLPVGTSVFPGVHADVVAVTAEVDDALTLPVSAVQRGGNGTSGVVYLLEKGKAPQRTNVTLGISDGKRIQIVSGLFAGQRVSDPAVPSTPTP